MGTTGQRAGQQTIAMDSVIAVVREQASSDLAGEAVILNLKNGVYYGLDRVGARVWQLLQEPRPVAAIRDRLLAEYEVTAEQCERDLLFLLRSLAAAGLIEVRDAAGA